MAFLRPVPMAKIGLVGLKDDREVILSVLHDLRVLQVEPIGKEALGFLEAERSPELQRQVSDQLVRVRGLLAALPTVPVPAPRSYPNLSAVLAEAAQLPIDEEVGRLKREEESLATDRAGVDETLEVLDRYPFYTAPFAWLQSQSLLAFFGEAKPSDYERIRAEVPALASATHFLEDRGPDRVRFLVAVPTAQGETVARLAQQRGVRLVAAPRLTGTAAEERPRLTAERDRLARRVAEIQSRLAELARQWSPALLPLEEALAIENRKLEVYPKLGTSDRVFAVEGWVPERERPRLLETLESVTRGRAIAYPIATDEPAPTILDNPPGAKWYEFFIRFYSLPQASEWDPTLTFAIVFPILFGFMLGDAGYGFVIFAISAWMVAGFPGGGKLPGWLRGIPKMVMSPNAMRQLAYAIIPGAIVAMIIGVLTNAYFGFSLPFYNALFTPLKSVGALLIFAGYLGLTLVVLGFLLGALKAYFHHQPKHVMAKVGGILAALGLAGIGLALLRSQLTSAYLDVLLPEGASLGIGVVLMFVGEGAMGLGLGFIEVLSHVLSYTRLVGILLASVILALVVNSIVWGNGTSTGLLHASAVGAGIVVIIGGIVLLVVVQTFNLVLGVFEPSIQGMRLMFVEYFSKFYEGGGKPFQPFGGRRTHTESAHVAKT